MTPRVRRRQLATVRLTDDSHVESQFVVVDTTPPWLELKLIGDGEIPDLDALVELEIGGSRARATVQRRWVNGMTVLIPMHFEVEPDDVVGQFGSPADTEAD